MEDTMVAYKYPSSWKHAGYDLKERLVPTASHEHIKLIEGILISTLGHVVRGPSVEGIDGLEETTVSRDLVKKALAKEILSHEKSIEKLKGVLDAL